MFHGTWFKIIRINSSVLTVRGGRPRSVEAVSGEGEVALEAQVEHVGSWEDGAGQRVAAEALDQRRIRCAAVTDLRDDRVL